MHMYIQNPRDSRIVLHQFQHEPMRLCVPAQMYVIVTIACDLLIYATIAILQSRPVIH